MSVRGRLAFLLMSAAFVSGVAAGPGWAQAPIELQVDRFGALDHPTGAATVTGTVTCPSGATATVSGSLSQSQGHRTTTAGTFLNPLLDGTFKGGPADVSVDAVVCLSSGCFGGHVGRRLVLRG
jgi:hypothetical protein